MFEKFLDVFRDQKAPEDAAQDSDRLRIATCVVLLEAAKADEEFSSEERECIVDLLRRRFSLSESEIHELLDVSAAERKESVDLWKFTHQINEACSQEEKILFIEEIWRVFFADGRLDAHEDYLAHKLAKLLNLTHPQLISAKLKARKAADSK